VGGGGGGGWVAGGGGGEGGGERSGVGGVVEGAVGRDQERPQGGGEQG